jgi:uncharacterized protein YwgA
VPPFFSTTREHALLAVVIQKASTSKGGYRLGRTAVQKVMYFLKALEVPMRYVFDIHYYGPYCSAITEDLVSLMADEIVRDESANGEGGSRYAPSTEIADLTSRFTSYLEENMGKVENVVRIFSTLPAEVLELLATVDFFYRREREHLSSTLLREKVIAEVKRAKSDKFDDETIYAAYDALARIGLLT